MFGFRTRTTRRKTKARKSPKLGTATATKKIARVMATKLNRAAVNHAVVANEHHNMAERHTEAALNAPTVRVANSHATAANKHIVAAKKNARVATKLHKSAIKLNKIAKTKVPKRKSSTKKKRTTRRKKTSMWG